MTTYDWYSTLTKPAWAPPPAVFGPVWSVLYIGIFISFGAVLWLWLQRQLPGRVALPFLLNAIGNAAFTPLQFGLRSNVLAAADILLVLGTLLWAIYAVYPVRRWIAYVQIPYLLWVSFATVLQLSITWLNW